MAQTIKSKSSYWAEFEYDFSMDKNVKHDKIIVQRQFTSKVFNFDFAADSVALSKAEPDDFSKLITLVSE